MSGQLPLAMRLRERAAFDSFITGPNAVAVAQLREAAGGGAARGEAARGEAARGDASGAAPVGRVYWLYGPAGVGKSHLLQASCSLALGEGAGALYLPLSQLLPFGPAALAGWEDAGFVALDELEQVIGRRDWEEALFALYHALEERGAMLLAAARRLPGQLPFALADLASRFSAAMPLALLRLVEAGQRLALQWRARARGLELPARTARYLQRRYRRDLPTLCALLDTIDVAALQAQRRLTVPFIREVLAAPQAAIAK